MAEKSGWLDRFYRKYAPLPEELVGDEKIKSYRVSMPVVSKFFPQDKIQPRKAMTWFGKVLNAISTGKQFATVKSEKIDHWLRENRFVVGFKRTRWQEHLLLTGEEGEHGSMTMEKGSFAHTFVVVAKEGEDPRELQNAYVSRAIYQAYKDVGYTDRIKDRDDDKLIPRQKITPVYDQQGNVIDIEKTIVMEGFPLRIRILRGCPPLDFVDIEIIEPFTEADVSNELIGLDNIDEELRVSAEVNIQKSFEKIDWVGVMEGRVVPEREKYIKVSRPTALEEAYIGKIEEERNGAYLGHGKPNVIVGMGKPDYRLDGFSSDVDPDMLIECGSIVRQAGSVSLIANHHFKDTGMTYVGSKPSVKKPNAKWSIHEAVMQSDRVCKLIERSTRSKRIGDEYLEMMGEYSPRTSKLFSDLATRYGHRQPDERQQIETVVALNQFQNEPIKKLAVDMLGFHRIQVNFKLPDMLKELILTISRRDIFERKFKSSLINAITAHLVTGRMMGIDVATTDEKNVGIDMAIIGLPLVEAIREIKTKMDETEFLGSNNVFLSKITDTDLKKLKNATQQVSELMDKIAAGDRLGAPGVNQANGFLSGLEWMSKNPAAVVGGLLRIGGHVSKETSTELGGVAAVFRSALAAGGTGVNFSEFDEKVGFEATIDDPHVVIDLLLPVIRGNTYLRNFFQDYLTNRKDLETRAGKKRVDSCLEMLFGERYESLNDYNEIRGIESILRAGGKMQYFGKIWKGEYEEERIAMAGDAGMKSKDQVRINDFIDLFNDFRQDFYNNLDNYRVPKYKLTKDFLDKLCKGGMESIWKQMTELNMAKYRFELAETLMVYSHVTGENQYPKFNFLRALRYELLGKMQSQHSKLASMMMDGGEI